LERLFFLQDGQSTIFLLGRAFASDSILPIVAEFENPQHEAFKERTAWSLYNACTERMKAQSPGRQVDGFKALNQVLVGELN
jgi:hypothetical protein